MSTKSREDWYDGLWKSASGLFRVKTRALCDNTRAVHDQPNVNIGAEVFSVGTQKYPGPPKILYPVMPRRSDTKLVCNTYSEIVRFGNGKYYICFDVMYHLKKGEGVFS